MTAIRITMDDAVRHQDELCTWLEAHGLRPECVSADPGPVIRDGRVLATLHGPDGSTGEVNLPLQVPLPDGVGTVVP